MLKSHSKFIILGYHSYQVFVHMRVSIPALHPAIVKITVNNHFWDGL